MLDEPDGVEAHAVGEHALLDRLFDDRVVVHHRALHLVGQTQSHWPLSVVGDPVAPAWPGARAPRRPDAALVYLRTAKACARERPL